MKHSKLLCLVLALVFVLGLAAPAMADGLSAAGEYPIWTGDEPYVLKGVSSVPSSSTCTSPRVLP